MKIYDIDLKDYPKDVWDDIIDFIVEKINEEISKPNYTYTDKNGNVGKLNSVSFNEYCYRDAIQQYSYFFIVSALSQFLGNDLVISNTFADCSVACSTDQGRIRSAKGKTPDVKTIAESISDGFFHYGAYGTCRHTITSYVHGITKLPKIYDEKVMEIERKKTEKRRYVERQIRKYKSLENDKKVNQWAQRDHDPDRVW